MLERNLTGRLISTTPRSGTWALAYFLRVLDAFCAGERHIHVPLRDFAPLSGLRLNIAVYHVSCPGFLSCAPSDAQEIWRNLQYKQPELGFDAGLPIIDANSDLFYPNLNDGARTVYMYRNPLDQAVSIFHHGLGHRAQSIVDLFTRLGSPRQYALSSGFEAYIKQFYSFYVMSRLFPTQILMMSYEHFIRDRLPCLMKIVQFLAPPIPAEQIIRELPRAAAATTSKSLAALEGNLGSSLGNDQQAGERPTHMRGGGVGKWREWFEPEDSEKLNELIDRCGIDRNLFVFE